MAETTLRQQLRDALRAGEVSFEGLCQALQIRRRELAAELRHVERTARASGERLVVTPAECEACGFVFRARGLRHLQPPGRCPECRSERIADPLFRLQPVGA
ncbi:MAG: transcriptional regulator [Planctomycetes bacterium]|nr:transcriptional regulator [Planctomycetota bacterium]